MATILVVEDSQTDRYAVERLLRGNDASLRVLTAEDASQAMSCLADAAPDVVLTDFQLPGMDGLELLNDIRSRYPLLPVVLMTAYGNEQTVLQALEQGAASYITKERLPDDLSDCIRSVLAASREQLGEQDLLDCRDLIEQRFQLINSRSLIECLVGHLKRITISMGVCEPAEGVHLGIALQEALFNALFHGNLEIDPNLRQTDKTAYYNLAARRQEKLPYKDRRIYVGVRVDRDTAGFVIRDEGRGFDAIDELAHFASLRPTDRVNLKEGRGLLLLHTFMDEVEYNEQGDELTLIKHRR